MTEVHPHLPFPPEIVDQVIDHLNDDPKALAACSLVSRAWVQRSYYHRFEKLAVSSASSRRIWEKQYITLHPHDDDYWRLELKI